MNQSDPALATLWLPFVEQQLPWPPQGAWFLRARGPCPSFAQPLQCEQSFKPEADALTRQGHPVNVHTASAPKPLVLLLPPRQRLEARALLARAVALTQDQGHVVLSAANNEGARSLEADLKQLTGNITSLSKHKCRAAWSRVQLEQLDHALLKKWQALDAVQPIDGSRLLSRPGVFAWDHIDAGSALLAAHLPRDLRGHAADLGAGSGYLCIELLQRCRGVTQLDVYEAEARALQLAQDNLANARVPITFHWHDVTQGLLQQYDVIISNPPFHAQTRPDRPDVGQHFIRAAADALRPNGQLWLVANRHLPYEQILAARFAQTRVVTVAQGYKIIHAHKPGRV